MIRYSDLVDYTKQKHISWNEDLFDVLKGFFEYYLPQPSPYGSADRKHPKPTSMAAPLDFGLPKEEFKEPSDGEYTSEDLINLFST